MQMSARSILEPIEPAAFRADPQSALGIWQDGRDGTGLRKMRLGHPVSLEQPPNLPFARAGPHGAVPVFGQGDDVKPGKGGHLDLTGRILGILEMPHSARPAHPATVVARHEQRDDLGIAPGQTGGGQAAEVSAFPPVQAVA